MIRYSANLGLLWAELPLLQRLQRAAASGFRAVEMHWPYDIDAHAVNSACDRLGLTLVSVNAPLGVREGDFGLAGIEGREAEFAETVSAGLEWAQRAGASCLHILSGMPHGGLDVSRSVLVRNLRMAAGLAAERGITILIEPMNRVDRPGYALSRADEAVEVIAAVGRPNLKLLFDTYHAAFVEADVAATLGRVLPHVGHVQIAAHPDRGEPDRGTVDHRALVATLARSGYAGFVGAEYRPRGEIEAGLGWIEALGPGASL